MTVRNPGTTTNISETIYVNDDPDLSQYVNGNFQTSATGIVVFYLTNQKRVDVLFTKAGFTSVTIPVDVQKSSLVSGYATIQDEGVALAQQPILNITGAGATATNDATNGRTNLAITGATLADAAPPAIAAAGAIGVSTDAAREDHTHSGSAYQALSEKGAANGYAPLGADSKVPAANLPSSSTFVGVRAHLTANQSIPNATGTHIGFDGEDFDSDGFHDNVTNNARLTVPAGKAGKYRVTGRVRFTTNATGVRQVRITKNGGTTATNFGIATSTESFDINDIVSLAVGDYVGIEVYQDSGAALLVFAGSGTTYVAMDYLGA